MLCSAGMHESSPCDRSIPTSCRQKKATRNESPRKLNLSWGQIDSMKKHVQEELVSTLQRSDF